jgi:FMN phosphatase YigB (HAD superfamily)
MNEELAVMLREFRGRVALVIATDNMDVFYTQWWAAHKNGHEPRKQVLKGTASLNAFDDVLCSARLGVLKSDSAESFFGPWLSAHNLSFADALLIDDSAANCRLFRAAGGRAFKFAELDQKEVALLRSSIYDWMNQ